jgi:MFS family permease
MLLFSLNYAQWYLYPADADASLFGDSGIKLFGLLVSINAVIVILFTPMLTGLTHRCRPIRIVALGGICYALSSLLFAVNGPVIYFYISILLLTLGEIVITIHANSFLAERTPVPILGRVNSYYSLITGSGNALAPLIAGSILAITGFSFVWIVFAAVVALGAFGMHLTDRGLDKHQKKRRSE